MTRPARPAQWSNRGGNDGSQRPQNRRTQRGRHRRRARHPEAAVRRAASRPGSRCASSMRIRPPTFPLQAPDGVAFPESAEEVQEIVRVCAEHRVPVIAFGVGTSLEGHVNAPGGGISLDMSRMNRVLEVNAEDLDCTVEAGVTRVELNDVSARHRAVLPDRSRRQRQPRRHGGNAGLGHQCGALRHDARQRAVADRGDGRRQHGDHRQAGEEELGGLRPDAASDRLGRHARHHHLADLEARTAFRRRSRAGSARSQA